MARTILRKLRKAVLQFRADVGYDLLELTDKQGRKICRRLLIRRFQEMCARGERTISDRHDYHITIQAEPSDSSG